MNTYEITLAPMFAAVTPDEVERVFPTEVVRVQGTSVDVEGKGYDGDYLVVKNGKEVQYMVSAHLVRSCKKVVPKKKRAKVFVAVADK